MRKILLSLFICSIAGIIAGQQFTNRLEKMPNKILDPLGSGEQEFIIGQKLLESNIGNTWYDLQTYGAIPQRLYAYPDGTIAAVWMMGFETAAWSDRGTGYNYYDGSQWQLYPTEKIESIRTGWPSYTPVGANGEAVVSHALPDVDWVILFNKRVNKGQGDWIETQITGPEAGVGIVWPAIVSGGTDHNTIHLLALTYGNPYMEQVGALLYYRSSDGGETWDIQNHFFDDLGYDYFVTIEADGYAWAEPHGNTIAFSVGFDAGPGCIMKSFDNGENWEFIEVYESPFYPPPGQPLINFGAGDGTQEIALDSEDYVHLVYGRMVYQYNDAGELFFYPASEGVIYWNESMPKLDSTMVSSYTLDFLIDGGNLAGQIVDPGISGIGDIPTYYTSLTSHPQMLIDGSNRIFVLWDGAAPGYVNGTINFRHIYGNSSSDGGNSWNGIVDFTGSLLYTFSESIYPAMSPYLIDNKFHFHFQTDYVPGIFVFAASQESASENLITHMEHETAVLTDVKINHSPVSNQMEVSQNFPNPFTTETLIKVSLSNPDKVVFLICDLTGKIVYEEDFGYITKDLLSINFNNPSLPSGIYYYTVNSDSGTFTGKMVIK